MPFKIVMIGGQFVVIFHIEQFGLISTTVPKRYFSFRIYPQQLIENVGSHGCHSCSTTNEHHLGVSF